jgi:hypothetical protein
MRLSNLETPAFFNATLRRCSVVSKTDFTKRTTPKKTFFGEAPRISQSSHDDMDHSNNGPNESQQLTTDRNNGTWPRNNLNEGSRRRLRRTGDRLNAGATLQFNFFGEMSVLMIHKTVSVLFC